MSRLREYVLAILTEAPRRGKRHDAARKEREELESQGIFPTEDERPQGNKRDLWHIGPKPAYPQPKMKYLQDWDSAALARDGEKGDWVDIPDTDNWQRWWLDSPVKAGVFLTPTPTDIARYHGRSGNVYHYKVPEWVIAKSGGVHRYDHGSELLISKEIWDEAGDEIEFVGRSMTKDQLWQKIRDLGGYDFGGRVTPPGKSKPGSFNLYGLRQTKHPRDAIKLMTDKERQAALAALEDLYPTPTGQNPEIKWEKVPGNRRGIPLNWFEERMSKKDLELRDLLLTSLKSVNEATIRHYVRETLLMEKMKTGRALDWYATQISREIVNAIKDDGIKQAVQAQGGVKFQMDIPEILDDLEWLEAVTVDIQGNLSDYVDAVAKYGFDINADDEQRKTSDIHVEILLPDDYSDSVLSRLVPKLKGVLRHELEHAGQPTDMLMKTQEKIPEGDIWKSLQSAEDYYLSEAEGKAHVAEFVKIAKTEKRPASQVIDEELVRIWQTGLAAGFSETELESLMKRIREAYHFYLQARWPDAALEIEAD